MGLSSWDSESVPAPVGWNEADGEERKRHACICVTLEEEQSTTPGTVARGSSFKNFRDGNGSHHDIYVDINVSDAVV